MLISVGERSPRQAVPPNDIPLEYLTYGILACLGHLLIYREDAFLVFRPRFLLLWKFF